MLGQAAAAADGGGDDDDDAEPECMVHRYRDVRGETFHVLHSCC